VIESIQGFHSLTLPYVIEGMGTEGKSGSSVPILEQSEYLRVNPPCNKDVIVVAMKNLVEFDLVYAIWHRLARPSFG